MIYFISAIFSMIVSCFVTKNNDKTMNLHGTKIKINMKYFRRNILIILSMIFPLLLSAFRYGIGTDYFYTYIPQFKLIAAGNRGYYESGFYWLNKLILLFTDNPQWLIAITSIIFVGLVYRQIYRLSMNYPISIALFFLAFIYFVSLNNTRQSIALAILMIAMECLCHKKNLLFVLFVLLASSMHQVALVFIVVIFAEWIKFSALAYLEITVAFFGVVKIIAPKIMEILVRYIPRLALYFNVQELSVYTDKTLGRLFVFSQFVIMLFLVYIDRIYKPEKNVLNEADEIEWNITKINQCLLLCTCAMDGFLPAAYRGVRVFSFAHFILLPNIIEKYVKKKKHKWLYYGLIIFIYFLNFIQGIYSGAEEVFPYVSIFNI